MTTTYVHGRAEEFTGSLWLVTEECYRCHMLFAIPDDFRRRARDDHDIWFYCPQGHRQHYTGKTDAQKLADAEARETALRDQLGASIREAEQVRVALLRDRQRFAAGVCPCCNRSFENVRRHMETKHPDYDTTRVAQPRPRMFKCSCGRGFESLHGLRIHQGFSRGDDWDAPNTSRWSSHLTRVD